MDVAFEKQDWTIEHGQTVAARDRAPADWSHPDWNALRARMRAARQTWQIMREAQGGARRSGSFDRGSAWQLTALRTQSAVVNHKASTNGKRGRDTYEVAAGLNSTGARGLK
jgi:hypothetical protein